MSGSFSLWGPRWRWDARGGCEYCPSVRCCWYTLELRRPLQLNDGAVRTTILRFDVHFPVCRCYSGPFKMSLSHTSHVDFEPFIFIYLYHHSYNPFHFSGAVSFFCSCVRFDFDCTVHMARRSSCIWGQCGSYIPYSNLENRRYTVSHVGGYCRVVKLVKSDCRGFFRLISMYCNIASHFAEVEIHVMVHRLSQPILHTECKIYHTTRSEYVIVAKYSS